MTPQVIEARIRDLMAVPLPWVIAESSGEVVGYAYAPGGRSALHTGTR